MKYKWLDYGALQVNHDYCKPIKTTSYVDQEDHDILRALSSPDFNVIIIVFSVDILNY
jgi:hypothetical protein